MWSKLLKISGVILIVCLFIIIYNPFSNSPVQKTSQRSEKSVLVSLLTCSPLTGNSFFGTDSDGREIAELVMRGAACYICCSVIVFFLSVLLGIIFSYWTSYNKGILSDFIESVILMTLESIPTVFILLIIMLLEGTTSFNKLLLWCISLGIIYSAKIVRIISLKVKILRQSDFIEASKELGINKIIIYLKHIIWFNSRYDLIIHALAVIRAVIFFEVLLALLLHSPFHNVLGFVSWGEILFNTTLGFGSPIRTELINEWLPILMTITVIGGGCALIQKKLVKIKH